MSSTPAPYNRQTNFVTEAQGNANITVSQIATELDAEFDAVNTSLDATQSRLAEIQRDDGALRNGIVTSASLTTDLLNKITTADNSYRGVWAIGTTYYVGDVVYKDLNLYYCATQHTATNFTTGLSDGKWTLVGATASDTNDPNAYVPLTRWSLTPNGSATVFTISGTTVTNSAAYLVTVDGVLQDPASYTITTNTITFSEAPPSGTAVVVVGIGYAKGIAAGAVTPANLSTGGPTWDTSGNLLAQNGLSPQIVALPNAANGIGSFTSYAKNAIGAIAGQLQMYCSTGAAVLNSAFNLPMLFLTNNSERMRIDSSGNVGIGTVSPTAPLSINGTSLFGTVHVISPTTNGESAIGFRDSSDTVDQSWVVGQNVGGLTSDALVFYKNQARAVIDASGNVGIGTSSPSQKLDVAGWVNTDANSGIVFGFSGCMARRQSGDGSLVLQTNQANLVLATNNVPRFAIGQGGVISTEGNPITNCPTTAKAWVWFDHSGTILQSNNVSSVTRTSTGYYTVNWANALSSSPTVTCSTGANITVSVTNNNTASVNLVFMNAAGTPVNAFGNVVAFSA